MRTVLIDTNAYSALLSGDHRVAEALAQSDRVLMCPIVIGELLDGFIGGTREKENRGILLAFQQKPRSRTIAVTEATAEWFALVKQQLRRKGRPVPINNVWIAACCMEHGARLISFDQHFEEIDGLLRWKA